MSPIVWTLSLRLISFPVALKTNFFFRKRPSFISMSNFNQPREFDSFSLRSTDSSPLNIVIVMNPIFSALLRRSRSADVVG